LILVIDNLIRYDIVMKLGKYDIPEDAFERNKKALKKLLDTRSYEMVRMRS